MFVTAGIKCERVCTNCVRTSQSSECLWTHQIKLRDDRLLFLENSIWSQTEMYTFFMENPAIVHYFCSFKFGISEHYIRCILQYRTPLNQKYIYKEITYLYLEKISVCLWLLLTSISWTSFAWQFLCVTSLNFSLALEQYSHSWEAKG